MTLLGIIVPTMSSAIPSLNSYPSSTATILLDFDGQDINNSMWNFGTPFNCLPAGLNDDQITEIFNRVSEDFRPFEVNVTTDFSKFLAAPLTNRIRVIITPTSDWYPYVSGIAYVGSFTWGDDTPCFVFSDRLANNSKRIAEAISHESGHSVGLAHQSQYSDVCKLKNSYNTGMGVGEISWAPIMGNAATKNLTQWNYGPTPTACRSLQDNLSIITTQNGFSYRPDDVGDIYNTSTSLDISQQLIYSEGIITTNTDKDIFRIDLLVSGKFHLNAEPYSVGIDYSGANLDIQLVLQDSKGITLNTYNITDSLNARIDTTLGEGTYYIIVDGTGNVNSVNDYGSLGSYSLSGEFIKNDIQPLPNAFGDISGMRIKTGNMIMWKPDLVKSGETIAMMCAIGGSEDFREISRPSSTIGSYVHRLTDLTIYTYKLKIIQESGSIRFTNSVTIDPRIKSSIFTIIRQPQQPLIINSPQGYEFQVINSEGKIIQSGRVDSGMKAINMTSLPAGIYSLRVINQNEQRVEKFLNG